MSFSRRDMLEGKVQPKVIEHGVVVPPALQLGEMTLAEHLVQQLKLTQAEAIQGGHRPDEIEAHFKDKP